MNEQILKPCKSWASGVNTSMSTMGFTAAGEWSNAINDCALFLNGVGKGTRFEGTLDGSQGQRTGNNCSVWTDYKNWSNATREGIKQFNLASMDAFQVNLCPLVFFVTVPSDLFHRTGSSGRGRLASRACLTLSRLRFGRTSLGCRRDGSRLTRARRTGSALPRAWPAIRSEGRSRPGKRAEQVQEQSQLLNSHHTEPGRLRRSLRRIHRTQRIPKLGRSAPCLRQRTHLHQAKTPRRLTPGAGGSTMRTGHQRILL
jgi:hypothetical protein